MQRRYIHTSISKFPTWISRFSRFSRFKNNLLNSYTSVITCNSAKIVEMKLTVQKKTCFSSFSFLEVRLQIKQAEVSISDMTMSSSKHGDQTKTFSVNSRWTYKEIAIFGKAAFPRIDSVAWLLGTYTRARLNLVRSAEKQWNMNNV